MPAPICESCQVETYELYSYEDMKNGIKNVSWCGKCLLAHCEKYYPGSPNHIQLSRRNHIRLEETFGLGYIKYRLLDTYGKEVPLTTVPETAGLKDVTYTGDFIMAVPLIFFKSPKWKGRGKSLYDSKSDNFDALDEVISQWVDAIRAGRVQKYIPEDLIPKNPHTGALLRPNPFDNQFIKPLTRLLIWPQKTF